MDITSMLMISMGSAGIIGFITWFFSKITGKDKRIDFFDIFKKTEKQEQEKINKITEEQKIIAKQIEVAEMSSEVTKQKIKETIKKATEEIQIILKEDKIAEIDKQIDKDWEEI